MLLKHNIINIFQKVKHNMYVTDAANFLAPIKSLPHNRILHLSKVKAITDKQLNGVDMIQI